MADASSEASRNDCDVLFVCVCVCVCVTEGKRSVGKVWPPCVEGKRGRAEEGVNEPSRQLALAIQSYTCVSRSTYLSMNVCVYVCYVRKTKQKNTKQNTHLVADVDVVVDGEGELPPPEKVLDDMRRVLLVRVCADKQTHTHT